MTSITAPWKLEIGYDATWRTEDASITWTDETSYLLLPAGVTTKRGRSSVRDTFDAGELTFTLKNQTRRFDPLYTAGVHYGKLLPGVPVRLSCTPTGQTLRNVWRGFIVSWPQEYAIGNKLSVVPVQAYDGFTMLARAAMPTSYLDGAIRDLSPAQYWPLTETSGRTLIEAINGDDANTDPDMIAGSDIVIDGERRVSGIELDGETRAWSANTTHTPQYLVSPGGGLSNYVYVYVVDETVEGFGWAVQGGSAGASARMRSALEADGLIRHYVYDKIAQVEVGNGGQRPGPAFVAARNASFYNGLTVTTDITIESWTVAEGQALGSTTSAYAFAGEVSGTFIGERGSGVVGTLSSLAAWQYPTLITEDDIATLAAAFLTPLYGQRADARITYVLDHIGWPATLRTLHQGQSLLGNAIFDDGEKALDYMRKVETSEDGRLFMGKDGKVIFLDRYYPYTATEALTAQLTFSDDGTAGKIRYQELRLEFDDELLVNRVTGNRRGGGTIEASDAASIAAYGEASLTLSDLLVSTDTAVRSLFEHIVYTRGTPLVRTPSIKIPMLRLTAAQQASILDLEVGYRVNLERTPQALGSAIDVDMTVEGINHSVDSAGNWVCELLLSPFVGANTSYWKWGTSTWGVTSRWAY